MSQDLSVAFREYLDRLVVIENRSPRTLDKYRRDGAKMVAFFAQHGQPTVTDVDRAAANAWVADLAKTLHPNTRRCRIAMAQGFFGDIKDLGLITVSPFAHYPRPKLVKQHRPFFKPHQAQLVFANIPTTTFDGARLRLLLMLCYHAGLRLAEALGLNWSDIDFSINQISVVGKGSQPGTMPVNDELRAELVAYQARWAHPATATSPVFVSRCGNRLLAKHVYPSLKKYGLKGMGQRLWRRSALTNLANASVPLHVVSGYARHASLASLTPYLQVTNQQLAQASTLLGATHPAAGVTPVAAPTARPTPPSSVRIVVAGQPRVDTPMSTLTLARTQALPIIGRAA